MPNGEVIFKPYFVQKGRGPHINPFILSYDDNGDPFKSDVRLEKEGVKISETGGRKFGINVRWNVEGYGYLFMPADNAGNFYKLPSNGSTAYNLNYELAKTRFYQLERRLGVFKDDGFIASVELSKYYEAAKFYLNEAKKCEMTPDKCAVFSQRSLKFSLLAAENVEVEFAQFKIMKNGSRPDFLFGCDSRGYLQMDKELFIERYKELFNFATITHYLKGDIVDFEPEEGKKQFKERDEMLDVLLDNGITIEGRPLFWMHGWVTPDWLKKKSFPELKKYLTNHIKEVVGHYGDKIKVWEVINELHDWANDLELDHKQSIELAKLACDVARDTNPNIKLLINNCCPFADYVQKGKWHLIDAKYPQRTPHQFTQELLEAGGDFDLIGVQVYFVHRTIPETVAFIERYTEFGKPLYLAEVGSPSRGVTQEFWEDEEDFSTLPYEWHRHWDEELQADWLEKIFSIAYSRPFVEAANWYDFVDPFGFLKSGGLLRSVKGEKKSSCDRLVNLRKQWDNL